MSLQRQIDVLIFEPLSPAEEGLRNVLAIVISILKTQYEPLGNPSVVDQDSGSNLAAN